MEYEGKHTYYIYDGKWNEILFVILTLVLSFACVGIIIAGCVLDIVYGVPYTLPISMILFIGIITWFCLSNINKQKNTTSVVVKTYNELWIIQMQARHNPVRDENGKMLPYLVGARVRAKDKKYIDNFIDEVKGGNKQYSFLWGGNRYKILTNYHLKKETKKYFYVEALVTTRTKELKKKVVKIPKVFTNLQEAFIPPKPYEPFGFSDGRN